VPDPAPDLHRRAQLLRAFRLSGVVPLAGFLVVHAALNARALAGDAAFLDAVRAFRGIPLLAVVEVVFVLAPLALHTAIGVWLVASRVPLPDPRPYPPGLRAALRASGVVIVVFLALHLSELRFHAGWARPSGAALLSTLDASLSSMWHGLPARAVIYVLGSAAVCFHLGVGLWGAFAGTARGQDAVARRRAVWWSAAVGAILWLLFADVVVFHATGARLFGSGASSTSAASLPCPAPSASQAP
jgi:succinate dehydrogenase / fumarate reductase cytochrome b subunit